MRVRFGPEADPHRPARVRLLAAEMDKRLEAAVVRSSGIETKAAFIVTASGLVAGSSALTSAPATLAVWSILPIVLALGGVSTSVRALWTRKVNVPDARRIINTYVDKPLTAKQLEDELFEVRTVEVEERENHNSARATIVTDGFVMLAAPITALLVFVVIVRQIDPSGDTHGPQLQTSAATIER